MEPKTGFEQALKIFAEGLQAETGDDAGQWTIKGFVDIFQNIYTISADTKIISKVLEIHLFPAILAFAQKHDYYLVPARHQNFYPDFSFVSRNDETLKFAVDLKTTYRLSDKPGLCRGFTLGSHGKYFEDRQSTKNIQFPYSQYAGHFCLGIIYDRIDSEALDETKIYSLTSLHSITSVISNLQFFVAEKWRIASDKSGSGNTANIGSINNIEDIINGNGIFSKLGEPWFDDYWMNFNKIIISDDNGGNRKINTLEDFVKYRKGNTSLIVPKRNAS